MQQRAREKGVRGMRRHVREGGGKGGEAHTNEISALFSLLRVRCGVAFFFRRRGRGVWARAKQGRAPSADDPVAAAAAAAAAVATKHTRWLLLLQQQWARRAPAAALPKSARPPCPRRLSAVVVERELLGRHRCLLFV